MTSSDAPSVLVVYSPSGGSDRQLLPGVCLISALQPSGLFLLRMRAPVKSAQVSMVASKVARHRVAPAKLAAHGVTVPWFYRGYPD
jgi:hypothetical protein